MKPVFKFFKGKKRLQPFQPRLPHLLSSRLILKKPNQGISQAREIILIDEQARYAVLDDLPTGIVN